MPNPQSYTVFVDENAHYQDESERYTHGEFARYEDAMAACKMIVDEFLTNNLKPGLDAESLFKAWSMFGEDTFIVPEKKDNKFSARDYVKERCKKICGVLR